MRTLKRKSGGGSGTQVGFRVEARQREMKELPQDPVLLADGKTLLGHEWKEIYFDEGPIPYGVPGRSSIDPNLGGQLMPLQSAIALAWTLVAQNRHHSLECQVVKHHLSYSWTMERKGVVEGLNISDEICFRPKTIDDVPADPTEPTNTKITVLKDDLPPSIAELKKAAGVGSDSD